jgi:predicted  nucleic acid-binding Zn-ribbon protein
MAASALSPGTLHAEISSSSTQEILEKSLSIVEIDREIGKIELRQEQIQQQLEATKTKIQSKERDIEGARDRAGERIRSYYMGEQEDLLSALLSVRNFRDFLTVADYIGLIIERDHDVIRTYTSAYKALQHDQQTLNQTSIALAQSKADLLSQKQRVTALQQEVDHSVENSSDPEKLRKMMEGLSQFWKETGLTEVRKYFRALDRAMKDFPEYLKTYDGSLVTNGLNYTMTVQEADLNAFLRGKNELFNNFAFQFQEGKVIAEGQEGELRLRVEGHYSIMETPKNAIIFHVDRLIFNGYTLPDTTNRELEQDFDLGFYPQQVMPFVKATSVELEQGHMIVKLKLAL